MGEIKASDNWNNRLKTISEGLAGLIPVVGKVIKAAIALFWPDQKVSIWSLIKSEVEHLVELKILEYELGERDAQLEGLKQTLKMYAKASNRERASLLSAIVMKCNELYSELTRSENVIHLIPVTIAYAYLHLTVLRERHQHGRELYPDAEDQTQWEKELRQKVDDYRSFFIDILPKWKKWREDEVTTSYKTKKKPMGVPPFFYWTVYGATKDAFSSNYVKYEEDWNKNKDTFKDVMMRARERVVNEAEADMMMDAYIETFSLNVFLPGHEHAKPKADPSVSVVSYGPYSVALTREDHKSVKDFTNMTTDQSDKCGLIDHISIWSGLFINRIKFSYLGRRESIAFGAPSSSPRVRADRPDHVINLTPTRHVTGMKMQFVQGMLYTLQFKFSDGTTSDTFGNTHRKRYRLTKEVTADKDFRLVGARAKLGTGHHDVPGVAEIKFIFQHVSVDALAF
jgi:hypothetical protein